MAWVGKYKSMKILSLIDRTIVLEQEKLHLLVSLKRSLEARAVRGVFRTEDMEAVQPYLAKLFPGDVVELEKEEGSNATETA